MANNAIFSRVKYATKQLAGVTSEDFGIKTDTVDVTTKDSQSFTEVFPVNNDGTCTVSMEFETHPGGTPTKAYLKDLQTAQLANTKDDLEFALSATPGDMKFTVDCYIVDIQYKGKVKDTVKADVTFKPTGVITLGTVS